MGKQPQAHSPTLLTRDVNEGAGKSTTKMMKLNIVSIAMVMSTIFSVTSAQDLFLGSCSNQAVVQNFDLNSYLGKWYEIEKYFAIFELGGKCITAEYSLLPNGGIKVVNTQTNVISGTESSAEGQAVLADPASGEAKLVVSFSPFGGAPSGGDGNYWVLDTDYTSYAVVWSCAFDVKVANGQFLWILMRDQNPDPQRLNYVRSLIHNRGLDLTRLQRTDQTNCS
ncbi:apolipoprotein D-like [Penaeus japonicus]|uniref:apolipoprotein D-like n=1 Tax=Penaeus japonicus TaxID=27405 RepID=UPI001C71209E|nr:apolipoprotein D-like [Penaeus japonicus]